jgi:hypothetical protein
MLNLKQYWKGTDRQTDRPITMSQAISPPTLLSLKLGPDTDNPEVYHSFSQSLQ